MDKMKIKFYQCGGEHEKPEAEIPLGIGYLMAYCQDIVNCEYVKNKQELRDCDYIGLSSVDYGAAEAVDILQNTDIPVIIGGQITNWEGLKDYPFEYIVKGEGESILYNNILNGMLYVGMYNDNLDDLPYPVFGEVKKTIPIITSRGCPFHCAFCSSQKFWGKMRYHSAEYVIEQLLYYKKKYPDIHDLVIHDDLFTCNLTRLRKIFELWLKNDLQSHYAPRVHGRAGAFTDEICKMLVDMGCHSIRFGAESGSDRILKILKKGATVADNQEFIDICNRNELDVTACYMYGYPFETEEDRLDTRRFSKRNKYNHRIGGWFHFAGFSGTEFYNGEDLTKIKMSTRN